MLEALRPQQGVDQISAYGGGDNSGKDIFHGGLLKAVATAHVCPTNQEKQNRDDYEKQV
jgi:hypothetical protein